MSAGHHGVVPPGTDWKTLQGFLADEAIKSALNRPTKDDNDHDVPYLAGYSQDGKTIYFDRHIPERITLNIGARSITFDPRDFLREHERFEKAVIDAKGWKYLSSHTAATGYERHLLVKRYGAEWWKPYTYKLKPFIKADEHERLITVPADLDMTPYQMPSTSRALLAAMKKAMGK